MEGEDPYSLQHIIKQPSCFFIALLWNLLVVAGFIQDLVWDFFLVLCLPWPDAFGLFFFFSGYLSHWLVVNSYLWCVRFDHLCIYHSVHLNFSLVFASTKSFVKINLFLSFNFVLLCFFFWGGTVDYCIQTATIFSPLFIMYYIHYWTKYRIFKFD